MSIPVKSFYLSTHEGFVGSDRYFEDFELDFPLDQITVILGASGIGKSTLLKAILGDLPKTSLSVHSPFTRLAWMAQQDLLLPWLNVLDNVLLGALLRGENKTVLRKKALDLLEKMGLKAWATAKPFTLSGGMRQRVALARTLMEDAPLILMDEPFSALDSVNRYHLQNIAAEFLQSDTKKTVVMVTHDPKEALRLGHKIVILGGFPARIHQTLFLDSPLPREISSPEILAREAQLLESLLKASGG